MLAATVQEIFPDAEVLENFYHDDLIRNDRKIQLDIYLPRERLAFEYHGEHHFIDIFALGNRWHQKQRDDEKRTICEQNGICLVEIPFYWDFEKESLKATIQRQRPDLILEVLTAQPISLEPPDKVLKGKPFNYENRQFKLQCHHI